MNEFQSQSGLSSPTQAAALAVSKHARPAPRALHPGVLFGLGLFACAWQFQAQGTNWVGGAPGKPNDWNTAANWSPATVPGAADNVTIPSGKAYYPLLTTPAANAIQALTINSGASLTLAAGAALVTTKGPASVAVNGTLSLSGGTLTAYQDVTGSGSLSMSGGTLQVGHDWHLAPAQFSATGGTVEWTGQVGNAGPGGFPGGTGAYQFFNVLVDGGVNPGFDNQPNSFVILGNWTNHGDASLTGKSTSVSFNGSNAQTIAGSAMTTFHNLSLSNSAGVSLATTATVDSTLTLSQGVLTTGANQLDLAAGAGVAGASSSSYIHGRLQKAFANGNNQSFTFPIGDTASYTPLSLAALNVTAAGTLTASTTAAEHPCIANSGINPTKDLNRFWTLTPGGLGISSGSATFNFVAGDVDGGANTAGFIVKRFSGGWLATAKGAATSTSITISGLSALGDFAVGQGGAPAPMLTTCCLQGAGCAMVGLSGGAGCTYILQASSDLVSWTTVGPATAGTNGVCQFQDPSAGSCARRFYRAVLP